MHQYKSKTLDALLRILAFQLYYHYVQVEELVRLCWMLVMASHIVLFYGRLYLLNIHNRKINQNIRILIIININSHILIFLTVDFKIIFGKNLQMLKLLYTSIQRS